jgi:hypothetical protein
VERATQASTAAAALRGIQTALLTLSKAADRRLTLVRTFRTTLSST